MKSLLTLIAALCFATEVYAQTGSCFADADGTRANCGVTNGYVNSSGVWIPVTPTTPMPTKSVTGSTTTATSTIAVTNTFQEALAESSARKGALLQNNGSSVMYVYFGTIGSATTSNAIQIQPGQTVSAFSGSVILTDAINVTGTSGDRYVVTSQ